MSQHEYTAFEVNADYHTWMVRRWTPPLSPVEFAAYQNGHLKVSNGMYVEALISGPRTALDAIQAAIKRESWG